MTPLWTVVSDDLTGLQAIAGEFARLGFRVGTGISRLPTSAEYEEFEVYGFDTATRPLDGGDAEARVAEAASHFVHLGATGIFKHNDSILQGHIGRELRAVVAASRARPIVYAPACPNRRRVTADGIQVELDHQGELRSGGLRANLAECVARGTGLTTRSLDLSTLRAGHAAAMIRSADCDVVIADAMTDEDLDLLVHAAEQADRHVLSGSVGLAAALARAAASQRRFVQPVVVVAGSLQGATRRQTEQLLTRPDCASIRVSPHALNGHSVAELIPRMRSALSRGLHCVIWASREAFAGADDGAYPVLSQECLGLLRRDLRALLLGVVAETNTPLGGLVVAGGSTADLALRDTLGVTRFTGLGWLCEGMTMALAGDGARPGLAVVTKSGGWGPPDALSNAIDRLSAWRCTQPRSAASRFHTHLEGIST